MFPPWTLSGHEMDIAGLFTQPNLWTCYISSTSSICQPADILMFAPPLSKSPEPTCQFPGSSLCYIMLAKYRGTVGQYFLRPSELFATCIFSLKCVCSFWTHSSINHLSWLPGQYISIKIAMWGDMTWVRLWLLPGFRSPQYKSDHFMTFQFLICGTSAVTTG